MNNIFFFFQAMVDTAHKDTESLLDITAAYVGENAALFPDVALLGV